MIRAPSKTSALPNDHRRRSIDLGGSRGERIGRASISRSAATSSTFARTNSRSTDAGWTEGRLLANSSRRRRRQQQQHSGERGITGAIRRRNVCEAFDIARNFPGRCSRRCKVSSTSASGTLGGRFLSRCSADNERGECTFPCECADPLPHRSRESIAATALASLPMRGSPREWHLEEVSRCVERVSALEDTDD